MKLICKDCKHYEKLAKGLIDTCNICTRNLKVDLVTGDKIYKKVLFCYAEREDALRLEHFRCGVDGKYFEMNMENT